MTFAYWLNSALPVVLNHAFSTSARIAAVAGAVTGRPRADGYDVRLRCSQGARPSVRPRLDVAERGVCTGIRRSDRVRLGAGVARRCADRDDAATRGRRRDSPEAMSPVPAG